jgi:23S rRNA (guanine745-N1)-methyltransferase
MSRNIPGMKILPFESLACPLDGAPLQRQGMTLSCTAGHCFDVASQGYVNLLPVQNKRSLDPGDSKEMVAARRRFLSAGHYAPIAAAVSRLTLDAAAGDGALACLDAGCGEGYYLRQLEAAARASGRGLAVLGLDISKWAVLAAAKQDRQAAWVVGSNAALPVLPQTLDRILCMFGFPVYAEFARVLRPGGLLLQVDTGPDHLRELREIIYPRIKPPRVDSGEAPAGFGGPEVETLRYDVRVEGAEAIADLLTMTPHLYRATAEGRARAAALTGITLTVDVRLAGYRRCEA